MNEKLHKKPPGCYKLIKQAFPRESFTEVQHWQQQKRSIDETESVCCVFVYKDDYIFCCCQQTVELPGCINIERRSGMSWCDGLPEVLLSRAVTKSVLAKMFYDKLAGQVCRTNSAALINKSGGRISRQADIQADRWKNKWTIFPRV